MRLIDAAIKDLEMVGDCRTCGNRTPFCDSNPDSCRGYKWRGAPPGSTEEENPPLTLEQLREMDGEPVWIRNHRTGDYICRVILLSDENFIHFTDADLCENWSYGSHWTAYRRKPEEGNDED